MKNILFNILCFMFGSFIFSQDIDANINDSIFIESDKVIIEKENDCPQCPKKWYFQNLNIVKSGSTRFGPTKIGDLYLEYEFFGTKDFFSIYGYIDFPKFFGTATSGYKGIWDGGAVIFMDIQPKFSLNSLFKKNLKVGPFKEWFISTNYVANLGNEEKFGRANNLWLGIGTDIDTKTKLSVSLNFYVRKVFENYKAPNEHSWDGFRFKFKTFLPLCKVLGGNLKHVSFGDLDFGSDLGDYKRRSSSSFVLSNSLDLSFKKFHIAGVARYFDNAGNNRYNSGWGYYLMTGLSF